MTATIDASPEVLWLLGDDTGASSKTIWWVMQGRPAMPRWWDGPLIPYDPDDFGRCYRLLKLFPAWRARLDEMRDVRGWAPLVDVWGQLEALYEAEVPTHSGSAPQLYVALQRCRKDAL